uniref:G-protein coupled receptor 52-like n=1 Tax=Myxine glutinosa TaxID=7769 RepID=UPI00358E932F
MHDNRSALMLEDEAMRVKFSLIVALSVMVIASNLLVMFVLCGAVPGWSRNSRYIMISLAVADLGVGLVVPLNLSASAELLVADKRSVFCEVAAFFNGVFFTSSIYSLTCISIERYLAVLLPLHYGSIVTSKTRTVLIAAAWLLPPLVLAPLCVPIGSVSVSFSSASLTCALDYASNVTYSIVLTFLVYFPCCSIITVANVQLWRAAHWHARNMRSRGMESRPHEDAASRVLLPVVLLFYALWSPCVFIMIYTGVTKIKVNQWIEFLSMWLPVFGSLLDCVVYFWINRSFRRRFQEIIAMLCKKALGREIGTGSRRRSFAGHMPSVCPGFPRTKVSGVGSAPGGTEGSKSCTDTNRNVVV